MSIPQSHPCKTIGSERPSSIRRGACALLAATCVAAGAPVLGYQGTPELRLNPVQHTAMINRFDMDRERRWLVTASDDKSVRLWGLLDGALQRVFRPWSGAGNEGKLFAVAVAPDASLIAAGGWTKGDYRGFGNHKVYLFDVQSGALHKRIAGLDNTILHLNFSPDTSRAGEVVSGFLACSLAGKNGIRVWNLENQTEALRDMTYAGDSYWAEFSPDGEWLVSTSVDGYLRLYGWREKGHQMERRAQVKLETTGVPMSARFSPDGGRIAVGYTDAAAVAVLSSPDLSLQYWTEKATGGGGDLFATAWSDSGEQLYGGGGFTVDARFAAVGWREGKEVANWPLAHNTLMQLDALGDQEMVYAASTPSWGIFGDQGESRFKAKSPLLDFSRIFPDELRLSGDAKIVEFGYSNGEQQGLLRFSFDGRLLAPPPRDDEPPAEEASPQDEALGSATTPQGSPSSEQAGASQPETGMVSELPAATEMTVEVAQRILTDLGYTPGPVDNLLGTATGAALASFQKEKGLPETGELTQETAAALLAASEPQPKGGEPPAVVMLGPKTDSETLVLRNWKNSDGPRLNDQPLMLTTNDRLMSYAFPHHAEGVLLGSRFRLRYLDAQGEERWQKRTPGIAWAVNVAANDKVFVAAFSDGTLRWYTLADGQELLALYPHADRRRWIAWTPEGIYAASVGGDELAGWALNNDKTEAADFLPLANLHRSAYRPNRLAAILAAANKAEAPLPLVGGAEVPAADDSSNEPPAFPPRLLLRRPRDGDDFSTPEVELLLELRAHGDEAPERLHLLVDGRPWLVSEWGQEEDGEAAGVTVNLPPRDLMLSVIAESEGGYTAAESIRLNWAGDEAPVNDSTLFFLAIGVADYGTREELPDLPHCAESARALAEKIPGHVMTEQIETKLLINPTSEEAASGLSWLSQVEAEDVALVYVCGHAMRRPGPAIDSFQLFPADIQTLEAGTFRESLTKPRGEVVLMLDTAHLPHDPQVDIDPRIADVAGFANALSQPWRGVNLFAAAVGDQVAEVDLDSGLTVFAKALVDLLDEPSDGESDEAFTLIELVDILSARVATATQGRQTPQLARSSLTSDFPLVTPAASVVARAKSSDGGAVAEVLAGELPESPASTAGDESTTTENDSRD